MDDLLSFVVLTITSLDVWGKILDLKVLFCQRYGRVLERKVSNSSIKEKF